MLALIDGDVVTYQCGFASDQTIYTCPDAVEFQYKKEAVQHCSDHVLDAGKITKHSEAEPVEHCLHSVKIFLNNIMEQIDADDYKIFLTGGGQDRKAQYPQYKANRDTSHKPHWYAEIHQYLQDHWGAEMIVGSEADDAMAWYQWRDKATREGDELGAETCICTIDKDLNMVPGLHYNWRANNNKGDMFWVTSEQANAMFFEQWLSGDSADNIPGLSGWGPVKAQRFIADLPSSMPMDMYNAVVDRWLAHGIIPAGVDSMTYIHMIGDLLWMQREPGQTWDKFYGFAREA